ncbi:MAG: DUF2306 domain-containing protein [Planctomycetia bacterium]|nr:DUF2306 domain-containing protein [Planctomycetia bacterium]
MPSVPFLATSRLLAVLTAVLILKVTAAVVFEYRHYMPPNFQADFLLGREPYFWGGYHWAFYVHLVAGPLTLVLGTVLVSERFRQAFPAWHRRLGRVQVASVLLLLAPSGLWMAFYAATGAVAGAGLGALAIVTAICVALGWRYAVQRRFQTHRRWMMRTFILLCSAVVIRLIGGLATVAEIDAMWIYPASAWASWVVPLLVYEIGRSYGDRRGRLAANA